MMSLILTNVGEIYQNILNPYCLDSQLIYTEENKTIFEWRALSNNTKNKILRITPSPCQKFQKIYDWTQKNVLALLWF